ncbi:hypothetical protein Tco_1057428 [Tanacetum coccineum]|uniref:Uncharacterized protein n=1 Tax=Tanacetum coccineum TaxID=301880 RepID=A0ABQ5H5L3_9ASTR
MGLQNRGQCTIHRVQYNWLWGAQKQSRESNPGQLRHVKSYTTARYRPYSKELHSTQATHTQKPPNTFKDKYNDVMKMCMSNSTGFSTQWWIMCFKADDGEALDSDIPVYDEASSLSYDLNILSEVHDHDQYRDDVCEHHEEHEMHDDVQLNYVVDSHVDYTSDSNMIPYDQYVKDNAVPVVPSNEDPSIFNMFCLNNTINNSQQNKIDMYEPHAQSFSKTTRNTVVDNSLTAELETYKEQVELYKRRVRFELTEREQKIDEQLRIVIIDRNIKEENLKEGDIILSF